MLKSFSHIIILFMASCLYSNIVINEIFYDPIGSDTGNEWIELYNNGDTDIDLEGAIIQVAGAEYSDKFTFPHYILRAHRYVLIGEQNVTEAIFTTNLVMQNGDTGTDGVRYVSPDGTYTDTVLYDSPNTSHLTDDDNAIGSSFAPDVAAGCSLARIKDGYDTNNCEEDFIEESNPTPGLPNRVQIDYGIEGIFLNEDTNPPLLIAAIYNYSIADDDTITIVLQVSLNGQLLQEFDIEPLLAGDNYAFSEPIDLPDAASGTLSAYLFLYNDVNPANNTSVTYLNNAQPLTLCVNEFVYNPESDNQEWIELYIPPFVCSSDEITIEDAADNTAQITLPSLCSQYLVVCRDMDLLLERYPNCPAVSILEVSSFPVLNNEGDSIILKDNHGVVLDSIAYLGNSHKKDYSLERVINADSTVIWQYSYDEARGTPGQPNSSAPPPSTLEEGHIKLLCSPFNPLANETMHLQYNFGDDSNSINCYVYDLQGKKIFTIASDLAIGSTGELVWHGKDKHGKPFDRGIYVLLVEAKNSSKRYFLKKQLTVVLATK